MDATTIVPIQTVPRTPDRSRCKIKERACRLARPFSPLSSLRLQQLVAETLLATSPASSDDRRWSGHRRRSKRVRLHPRKSGHRSERWNGHRHSGRSNDHHLHSSEFRASHRSWEVLRAIRRSSERRDSHLADIRRTKETARSAAAYPTADGTMIRGRSCPRANCCRAIPSNSAQSGSSSRRCCRALLAHSMGLATLRCPKAA
jgi:hypothetical protein